MITPLHDYVVIEQEMNDTTKSGLVLPESAQKQIKRGTIVAVGAGKFADNGLLIPMVVKVDDVVMYQPFSDMPIKIDDKNFLLVKQDNIVGIL